MWWILLTEPNLPSRCFSSFLTFHVFSFFFASFLSYFGNLGQKVTELQGTQCKKWLHAEQMGRLVHLVSCEWDRWPGVGRRTSIANLARNGIFSFQRCWIYPLRSIRKCYLKGYKIHVRTSSLSSKALGTSTVQKSCFLLCPNYKFIFKKGGRPVSLFAWC